MLQKYYLINAILISVAIFLGYKLYADIQKPINVLPSANKAEVVMPLAVKDTKPENIINLNKYLIINEKDLFRPERKKADDNETAVIETPVPILAGIIINKNGGKTFFIDPVSKTTKVYKKNDIVSGYIVNEILGNKVLLTKGAEKLELKISSVKTIEAPGKSATNYMKDKKIQRQTISKDREQQAVNTPQENIKAPSSVYIPPRKSAPISLATVPKTKEP